MGQNEIFVQCARQTWFAIKLNFAPIWRGPVERPSPKICANALGHTYSTNVFNLWLLGQRPLRYGQTDWANKSISAKICWNTLRDHLTFSSRTSVKGNAYKSVCKNFRQIRCTFKLIAIIDKCVGNISTEIHQRQSCELFTSTSHDSHKQTVAENS